MTFWMPDLESLPEAYQVAELKHQKVGDRFYTPPDTLQNVRMLKDAGGKSHSTVRQRAR